MIPECDRLPALWETRAIDRCARTSYCVAGFPAARALLWDLNAATACGAFLILGDRTSSLPKSSQPISVNNFTKKRGRSPWF
ncbi:hypothetical protein [Microcoleus sp. T3_D1]|uniref:hypothetical protein n=1 Tax=Microcoleus sp. T3_D1 TaxID=3055427 RepID=UPI002FCE9050